MTTQDTTKTQNTKTPVWDWPTRLFHILLMGTFSFLIFSGFSGSGWKLWHMRAGYLLLGLMLFRVIWGLVGSHHARFKHFATSPKKASAYLLSLRKKQHPHLGHNPAGALMVIALLLTLTLQAVTGLVTSDDIFWSGPFYSSVPSVVADWGARLHHFLPNVLLALVAVHITAVFGHEFVLKDSIIMAMVHGKKPRDEHHHTPKIRVSITWLLVASVSMVIGTTLLWLLPI